MASLETRISELVFTTKERHALDLLGISTVRELLCLDVRRVLSLRGYGARTYESLRRTQRRLRRILPDCQVIGNGGATSLQSDIEVLLLTARGRNVLRRLGVNTVGEFLALDLRERPKVRGCGVTTHDHLVEAQAQLRSQFPVEEWPDTGTATPVRGAAPLQAKIIAAARAEARPDSWRALPLFSGERLDGITPSDLHRSYYPDTAVEYLRLPKRASRGIRDAGIERLGQLLLTPYKDLLGASNFGEGSLAKTQEVVAGFLRNSLDLGCRPKVDYSSPGVFLASLVSPVLTNKRQRRIFLLRAGWDGAPRTLEELGQEYGVTRERIRQIDKAAEKKLTSWLAGSALSPLRDFIVGLLKERGPLLTFSSICRELQRTHDWDSALNPKAIERLLPAFPGLKHVGKKFVASNDFRCTECATLPTVLEQLLNETTEKELPLARLASGLFAVVSVECASCPSLPTRPSTNLVRLAFWASPTAQMRFHLDKRELWNVDKWKLVRGPLSAAVEAILHDEPSPLSYEEVHKRAMRFREQPVSPRVVWHALSACTAHGNVLLWDRGGVYRHRRHVSLYAPLLNDIEKWVVRMLQEGNVPQISANAAFRRFRAECNAAGITSEYAVHSCLKHRQHPRLAFFHSPYIGLAGVVPRRIPNVEIAEDLIRQEGEFVSLAKLRKVLCRQMGLKHFQFAQVIDQLDNVIRTEDGFLHADYFDAENPSFVALVSYVVRKLEYEGELSAQLIYDEKRVSCIQLGIDGPRMLFSTLAIFCWRRRCHSNLSPTRTQVARRGGRGAWD